MTEFFLEATEGFLQPIAPYLADEEVSEIMVNGPGQIFIEKKGKIQRTSSKFEDEEDLMAAVRRIAQSVGKTIGGNQPIMDARLEDGSRVHVVLPPCARNGVYLSIRRFSQHMLTMKELVKASALTLEMAKFINLCVAFSKNLIVSGGTSSGKTTLLNVVSSLIPEGERIVVIEDATELNLQQDHVLPMETRAPDPDGRGGVAIRDLLKASLRMRPDRIVIGEVRGGEAMDLLQALNTGHAGSMATLHANTPVDALSRLETLALMSDVQLPWRALRNQVASAIDIVIQVARLRDGSRKITAISEILDLDADGHFVVRDLFTYESVGKQEGGKVKGVHKPTGELPTFLPDAMARGYKVDESLFGKKAKSKKR